MRDVAFYNLSSTLAAACSPQDSEKIRRVANQLASAVWDILKLGEEDELCFFFSPLFPLRMEQKLELREKLPRFNLPQKGKVYRQDGICAVLWVAKTVIPTPKKRSVVVEHFPYTLFLFAEGLDIADGPIEEHPEQTIYLVMREGKHYLVDAMFQSADPDLISLHVLPLLPLATLEKPVL